METYPETDLDILLVDDHNLFLEALALALSREPRFKVVGTVSDGREAVRAAADLRPDLVVMDVAMPGMNGIEAARSILRIQPRQRVLMLSESGESRYVAGALRAGASGYLLKHCGLGELTRAIRTVAGGAVYLSPAVGDAVVSCLHEAVGSKQPAERHLTAREREVLQLVAEGRSTKEIARRLHLAPRTVGTHRENIMEKLGIRNVAQLTKYAVRQGLTHVG